MRHKYKGRKLGTSPSHTKAMKRSLTAALLYNDRIKTVESRAKEIRPEVDRIITWAKKGDLHSRRLAIARLGGDKELVREIFEKVDQGMFADRQGGYTRIMKLGPRKGDGAPMVIIELCTEPVKKKGTKAAEPKKATKKAAPKKVEAAEAKADAAEEKIEEKAELEDSMLDELAPIEGSAIEETEEELKEALDPAKDEEAEAEAEKDAEAKEKKESVHAEEVREEEFKAEEAKAEKAAAVEADKELKSHE